MCIQIQEINSSATHSSGTVEPTEVSRCFKIYFAQKSQIVENMLGIFTLFYSMVIVLIQSRVILFVLSPHLHTFSLPSGCETDF